MNRRAEALEALYQRYNKRCYVHPDPLECVYPYKRLEDREVAAFIAASLAYGNVRQILKSVSTALSKMGNSPFDYLQSGDRTDFYQDYAGFVHRFATGRHVAAMLCGVKRLIDRYGSLYEAFKSGSAASDANYLPALKRFTDKLRDLSPESPGHLVAAPEKGSACKRLNLFLRWMIRCDDVDPGGWHSLSAARLIVPLDVHMHRACCNLNFSARKQANMKTAVEITAGFAAIAPHDPVRYDFVLTRPGIRGVW